MHLNGKLQKNWWGKTGAKHKSWGHGPPCSNFSIATGCMLSYTTPITWPSQPQTQLIMHLGIIECRQEGFWIIVQNFARMQQLLKHTQKLEKSRIFILA